MKTNGEIEGYLMRLGPPYDTVGEGMWVVHDEENGVANIAVIHDPPLVVFRVKVMEIPPEGREKLFRHLLELNASDLVHGAYGIERDNIVLIDTLEDANLDLNEVQASIESLVLALTSHHKVLGEYRA